MRSFLVRKINNFTKTLSLRAKVPNTYGTRLYFDWTCYSEIHIVTKVIMNFKDWDVRYESLDSILLEGIFS